MISSPQSENLKGPRLSASSRSVLSMDEGTAQGSDLTQRPFSPLTLDELGLHPSTTPSALLDIVTPISLKLPGSQAPKGRIGQLATESSPTEQESAIEDGGSRSSADQKKEQILERASSQRDSHRLDSSAAPSAPATEQDSFLTSFLESLTASPIVTASRTSVSSAPPKYSGPMNHISATTQKDSDSIESHAISLSAPSSTISAHSKRSIEQSKASAPPSWENASSSAPEAFSQSTALPSLDTSATVDFSQFFQAAPITMSNSNQQQESSGLPASSFSILTSDMASISTSRGQTTTSPSFKSMSQLISEGMLVTSTPLEASQASMSTQSRASAPTARLRSTERAGSSAHTATWGGQTHSKALLSLSSMKDLSLPQAPPLQPEHRYPIAILETDRQYDTDADTDRESETSPSYSAGFNVTSITSSSTAVPNQPSSASYEEGATGAETSSRPPSAGFDLGRRWSTSELPGHASTNGSDKTLEVVPLSNVVRSRSWSSASVPPVSSSTAPAWLIRSAQLIQAERMAQSRCLQGSSVASPSLGQTASTWTNELVAGRPFSSAANSTSCSPSYDFTRQALLDLIRRTDLGMTSGACPKGSVGSASILVSGSSTGTASATADMPKSSSDSSVSTATCAPADLQTRLQCWQQHRKRQRLSTEFARDANGHDSTSTSRSQQRQLSGDSTSKTATRVDEQSRQQKRNAEEEQKARKQEQYRRLLLQLNAQMQFRMQMDLQKRKQKQSSDQAQPGTSQQGQGDKENGTEFKKPSPPSKTPALLRRSSSGFNTMDSSGVSHSNKSCELPRSQLGSSAASISASRSLADHQIVASEQIVASDWNPAGNTQQGSLGASTTAGWSQDQLPFNQPSRFDGPNSATCSGSWPWTQDPAVRTSTASSDIYDPRYTDLALQLMMKHPNWLRDVNTSALVPPNTSNGASYASSSINTFPFAAGSSTNSATDSSCAVSNDGTDRLSARDKPRIRRPFSPGAEVVFWAVKGAHSVKLTGKVESVSLSAPSSLTSPVAAQC